MLAVKITTSGAGKTAEVIEDLSALPGPEWQWMSLDEYSAWQSAQPQRGGGDQASVLPADVFFSRLQPQQLDAIRQLTQSNTSVFALWSNLFLLREGIQLPKQDNPKTAQAWAVVESLFGAEEADRLFAPKP